MAGYPSTTITYVDNTIAQTVPASSTLDSKPILMTVSASNKGWEDFRVLENGYIDQYGDISFAKYGQAQTQIKRILDAGGAVWHKRVVASDATLAHFALKVALSKEETQKTNSDGALLYTDADGNETTVSEGNTPVMLTKAKLKYGTVGITDATQLKDCANDPKELAEKIKHAQAAVSNVPGTPDDEKKQDKPDEYLLWLITDSGRGESNKRITITPDYASSKSSKYMKYIMNVAEGTNSSIDNVLMFSLDCSVIDVGVNRSLQSIVTRNSSQLRAVDFDTDIDYLYADLAKISGYTEEFLKENDVLFGCTRKGVALPNIEIDTTGLVLNNAYGIPLISGSNGNFGSHPINSEEYMKEIANVFSGKYSADVYDLNNVRINAIFDANYSSEVKRAIETLVQFREDTFYFRDLGVDIHDIDEAVFADNESLKSKFIATYANSYDIYDPTTLRQITVTVAYDLAALFVGHYKNGINRPFAGLMHGIIFPNIIEGTLNFIPKKIPSYDQPQTLYDANINYIVTYQGTPTMETQKTSQEVDSDFSYINNILAIQDIIRDVRYRCPIIRYTFKSADDFEKYQKDIDSVLNKKLGFFDSLALQYLEDESQVDSKAYYAVIEVKCKDFIEKEYFKVTAI